MPELHPGPRRNRAAKKSNLNRNPIKHTVQTRRRRTADNNKEKNNAIAIDVKKINLKSETTPVEEKPKAFKQVVAQKTMDDYDSGGRSGDKGVGAEDEGSMAPLS